MPGASYLPDFSVFFFIPIPEIPNSVIRNLDFENSDSEFREFSEFPEFYFCIFFRLIIQISFIFTKIFPRTVVIFDAQFLMILHILVLQCTINCANLPSNPLISNLHALRSILNPILNSFKWLDFWLILADFPLTVLKYSTFPIKSVFIFGFSMVKLVCMRSFSKIFRWAAKSPCAARSPFANFSDFGIFVVDQWSIKRPCVVDRVVWASNSQSQSKTTSKKTQFRDFFLKLTIFGRFAL